MTLQIRGDAPLRHRGPQSWKLPPAGITYAGELAGEEGRHLFRGNVPAVKYFLFQFAHPLIPQSWQCLILRVLDFQVVGAAIYPVGDQRMSNKEGNGPHITLYGVLQVPTRNDIAHTSKCDV